MDSRKIWFSTVLMALCGYCYGLDEFLGGRPLDVERVVLNLIEYYKQDDPHGIPVLEIPEPFHVAGPIAASVLKLTDLFISGHSGLRLVYVNVNLTDLTAETRIRLPRLQVLGTYEYSDWLSSTMGAMNLTFVELELVVNAQLGATTDGFLELSDMQIVVNKEAFIPQFDNTTLALQLVVGAAETFFDTLVTVGVQGRVGGIRETINARLADRLIASGRRYPDVISPVDLIIARIRKDVLAERLEPLKIPDKTVNIIPSTTLELSNIAVQGLSTIHRTREISTQVIDNRLLLTLQIGTQRVQASTDWSLSASILPSVSGHFDFHVDSLEIHAELQQAADVRHPPVLRRLRTHLGNFALHSPSESTASYFVESAVNILPNLFRNVITEAVTPRLQQIVQRRLNTLDVEGIILQQVEKMKSEN